MCPRTAQESAIDRGIDIGQRRSAADLDRARIDIEGASAGHVGGDEELAAVVQCHLTGRITQRVIGIDGKRAGVDEGAAEKCVGRNKCDCTEADLHQRNWRIDRRCD